MSVITAILLTCLVVGAVGFIALMLLVGWNINTAINNGVPPEDEKE